MTIDVSERRAALDRVLTLLAEHCGDMYRLRFSQDDLTPAQPLRITLAELKDAGFGRLMAQPGSSQHPYGLTAEGWYQSQVASGRFSSEEFDKRRGRLFSVMKRATAARHERVIMRYQALAEEADVPADWLLNMLELQVFHRLDPKGRFALRFEKPNVWIEPTFGQEPAF